MRVVVVGAGLAGGSAAATLREAGFDGDVLLVGEEPDPPYDRPPLSKAFLQGEDPDIAFKPAGFWDESSIATRLGVAADAVDAAGHTVAAGGETIPYDRLLLATGGQPRRLEVPGAGLDGIHLLRTIADARRLRDDAAGARRAVVVGMGFIGAEVAASLRIRGLEVVAVEPLAAPLERVLGVEVGRAVEALHRDHGVTVRLGDGVTAFEGSGRVERVVTSSGARIGCDLVCVGVGIAPDTRLAEAAGIACANGILVDARCRTDAPDVYAAGDVAAHDHPLFGRIRVEHWQNAIAQGAAAARAMLGEEAPYDDVHWFWSDQYDASIQYAGHHTGSERIVFRGSVAARDFAAFYLDASSRPRAVAGFNRGRDVRRAMTLIRAATPVDPHALADEDTDLRTLAG